MKKISQKRTFFKRDFVFQTNNFEYSSDMHALNTHLWLWTLWTLWTLRISKTVVTSRETRTF